MEILERGIPKSDRKYQVRCFCCESLLEFKHSEARMKISGGKVTLFVVCPVCAEPLHVNEHVPPRKP